MLHVWNRLRLLMGRVEYEASGLMDEGHLRWYLTTADPFVSSPGSQHIHLQRRASVCGLSDSTCS